MKMICGSNLSLISESEIVIFLPIDQFNLREAKNFIPDSSRWLLKMCELMLTLTQHFMTTLSLLTLLAALPYLPIFSYFIFLI